MNRLILLAAVLLAAGVAAAQPRLRTEYNSDYTSATLYLDNKEYPGTATVILVFKDMINCTTASGPTKYEVLRDHSCVTTLRAADKDSPVRFNFTWHYITGCVDPKVDSSFVYRMPCRTDRPVRVGQAVDAVDAYAKRRTTQKGYSFLLQRGDTVYAMRRGTILNIYHPEELEYDKNAVEYTSEMMQVTVEHSDGTMASYSPIDRTQMFVAEGDEVFPGTPLGLIDSWDDVHFNIRVRIYWIVYDKEKDKCSTRQYFPFFATSEGILRPVPGNAYTAVETPEMVEREMSKKELKKYRSENR